MDLFLFFFAGILLSKFCSISPVLVHCYAWPVTRFLLFLLHLLCLLGALTMLQVWVHACCAFLELFLYFLLFLLLYILFEYFLDLFLCCLRRPSGCVFCCFVDLVCFEVEVRCAGELVPCFVWVCEWIVPFWLYVSRANLLIFTVVAAHSKTCRAHPFGALFALFLLPSLLIHSSAPIRTDLHPAASICVTFCRPSQNMMSGEISPAMWPQILPCETLNVPCLPCFCVARVPCSPLHPSVPILTHSYLLAPVYTQTAIYIM